MFSDITRYIIRGNYNDNCAKREMIKRRKDLQNEENINNIIYQYYNFSFNGKIIILMLLLLFLLMFAKQREENKFIMGRYEVLGKKYLEGKINI